MSEVVVDTKYLRGYGRQLESIADDIDWRFQSYISRHCNDTEGMDGWLSNAGGGIHMLTDAVKGFNHEIAKSLASVSMTLNTAADRYDRTDNEAASSLFRAASSLVPKERTEADVPVKSDNAFPQGVDVELPTPNDVRKAPPYRKRFHEDLDDISPWIESVTGLDLLKMTQTLTRPEWGSLDKLGEAYRHCADWYSAAAGSLISGMDILSTHWTHGEASVAFDYFVRERWKRHLKGDNTAFRMVGEDFEYQSAVVDAAMEFLAGSISTFADFVRKMRRAMDEMSAEHWLTTAKELTKAVLALWKLLKTLGRTLGDLTDLADIAVDLGYDEAATGVNFLSGYNQIPTLKDSQ